MGRNKERYLRNFRFYLQDFFGTARELKASLSAKNRTTQEFEAMKGQIRSKRQELHHKRQELQTITNNEARAAKDGAEAIEHIERKERVQQEIFQLEQELERDLRTTKEQAENRR